MNRTNRCRALAWLVLSSSIATFPTAGALRAQPAPGRDAAEIQLGLQRLRVMGSALYVAAHPDDENTAFLAWLANGRLVRTAYLSMTRGDGGQNLLGDEKGDLLGLIRTQELLAARRIDGARQFFTRAIDFGYSKSPEETLATWGHERVLSDVVRVIRSFRPDVIVTRFPTTGEGGHGHHTASAILAEEAFTAAADPRRFPEQLAQVRPWQAKRLLWNVFRFRPDSPRDPQPGQVPVDLGAYNPLLGRSYTEIAALSRSMHKSQGFGSAQRRGSFVNDFQPRLGDAPTGDLFDGIDLSWKRVPHGGEVETLVDQANRDFRPDDPAAVVPILIRAYAAMGRLGDEPLVAAKRQATLDLIRECSGLWLEAIASAPSAPPGSAVTIDAVALVRSSVPYTLESVTASYGAAAPGAERALDDNRPARVQLQVELPADLPYSDPYWLVEPHGKGLFTVGDPTLVGRPESPPALQAKFTLRSGGERLAFEAPVLYRWTDPVLGERYRRFEVAPPVTLELDEKLYLFAGDGEQPAPRPVRLRIRAGASEVAGTVRPVPSGGWKIAPESQSFSIADPGGESELTFTLTAPPAPEIGALQAIARIAGPTVDRGLASVDYPHIPVQVLFPRAESKLVRLGLRSERRRLGYIMGSGDEIPDTLRQLGYRVTLLSDDDLADGDLSRFDTLVTGVRAYNTRPRLARAHDRLMRFVQTGGTYVVQYATTADLVTPRIGPYPFALSHDRVTEEDAPVTFVDPRHPLLAFPNRITAADFEGWVQERGLYFASESAEQRWDSRYQTVLASHDAGESDRAGGLLYARYGKGVFIYTGYSFFRQLPAGVPGAVRLFVNLVSAGAADATRP